MLHRNGDAGFLDALQEAIAGNRLVLPSLPEVAQRVREAVEDPDARAEQVARVIGSDAAMSARLLKVANSPLYRRTGAPIEDLRTAVTRLGLSLVRTLIVNLSILQSMRPHRGDIGKRLHEIFQHSVGVASWSYALADRYTDLNPSEAMLAGMVHDVGYLPILQYVADHKPPAPPDGLDLPALLHRHHAAAGAIVLDAWHFGDRLKEVVRQHENVYRTSLGGASLVDVVIVAELCAGHENDAARPPFDSGRVPALAKLGLADAAAAREDARLALLVSHGQRMLRA